jgi:organic radical activating enzyme
MNKFDNTLCNRVFTQLSINLSEKSYGPCCKFKNYQTFEGNINFHENLRRENLNNIWNKGCESCKKDEELKTISHRLQYFHKTDKNQIENNEFILKHIEITLDNNCNLACITCNENASSRWLTEKIKMGFIKKPITNNYEQDFNWLLNYELWKNVETLVLHGGEPLSSKKIYIILDWLIKNDLSKNIILNFYTNGTFYNKLISTYTKKFKLVDIQFSVDGVDKNFEIIRWPAKWSRVSKNINLYKKLENVLVCINYTVSILNIFNIKNDFYELKKISNKVNFNYLENPNYYNIKNLPISFKESIKKDLEKNPIFYNIVKRLESDGDEKELINCFLTLKNLDCYRKTNSLSLFPENFIKNLDLTKT